MKKPTNNEDWRKSVYVETIQLERFKFGIQQRLDKYELSCGSIETLLDHLSEDIVFRVEGFVWAKALHPVVIKHPADWKQAFKERWFPRWALKRWPVKMREHRVEFWETYPDFKPAVPKYRHAIQVRTASFDETAYS